MPNIPDVEPDEAANVRRELAATGHRQGFERADEHIGDALPERKPELIRGVLRQGHKLMLAAQSKAGKTWTMIDLALSVANGYERLEGDGWQDGGGARWLGRECRRGEAVLFDGEMDVNSLWHRIDLVARAKWPDLTSTERMEKGRLLYVKSLRGDRDVTADSLLGMLDNAFGDEYPAIVIIDPIYKLLEGDENSNSETRDFLKSLDAIAARGACVATTHHHAKGKAADRAVVDRAAGAGSFVRDPDAFIDLSALDVRKGTEAWGRLERLLPKQQDEDGEEWQRRLGEAKLYRANYVLREFKDGFGHELLFDFPLLRPADGFSDVPEDGSAESGRQRGAEAQQAKAEERWKRHDGLLTDAIDHLGAEGIPATRKAAYEEYVRHCEAEDEKPYSAGTIDNETKASGTRLSWVYDEATKTLVPRGE